MNYLYLGDCLNVLRDYLKDESARVGCISEASYTFEFLIPLVHDTAFMHPTLAKLYYMRNLRGKAARIKEKITRKSDNKAVESN
jgi:Ribosomal protein L19